MNCFVSTVCGNLNKWNRTLLNSTSKTFNRFTFTFMHLADAFIQSDLQCIQAIHFFVCVFPGNSTHGHNELKIQMKNSN